MLGGITKSSHVQLTLCSRVTSIENNHKEVPQAKKGTSVAVKIVNESNPNIMYGRHFDANSALYSKVSRASIDALKEFFKRYTLAFTVHTNTYFCSDVSKEEWQLIIKLKSVFSIA